MKVDAGNELEMLLLQYKALTANLIEILEKDDFGSLEGIFEARQKIILDIDKMEFASYEFKEICKKIELLPLQQKLILMMNEKKTMLNNEVNSLETTRVANKSYNKGYSIDSLYFNKKI